jgi:sulfatase modifying factor 1
MRMRMLLAAVLVMAIADFALADTIRGINMDFATIGRAGNPGDTRAQANPYGCGSVNYNYRIGKYEVSHNQWTTFTTLAGTPTGTDGGYSAGSTYYGNMPVNNVSWYEAAQFCNYLTSGDKSKGVYQFSGTNSSPGSFVGINRSQARSIYGITYFLPTENEWYKAAYYKPDGSGYSTYANGTNTAPVAGVNSNYYDGYYYWGAWEVTSGTQEQNGTYNMMGNFWEWNETTCGYTGYENSPVLGIRGGSWVPYSNGDGLKSSDRGYIGRESEYYMLDFRVASDVPEPCTILLFGLGAALLRKKK